MEEQEYFQTMDIHSSLLQTSKLQPAHHIKNVTVIAQGSTTTAEDPRGFNAGDAGKGSYVDGAYATANSKKQACYSIQQRLLPPG